MNIEKLFENLSYGVLSNLSLSVEGTGAIEEQYQPRMILYANEALINLYSQFVLSEKDLIIQMDEHTTKYSMDARYAESNVGPAGYIKDLLSEPFKDDVIKILAVYNSFGILLPLNDNESPASLFTPKANVLQVPHPQCGASLSVLYQAKHEPLFHTNLKQNVEVPDVLESALYSYIAYKAYSHMNTAESSVKSQEHYAMYRNICAEVVDKDLVNSSVSQTNSKFRKRGWI